MSYNITLTNGTSLTVISDGQIDQVHTDLTLIGKNATSYGLFFNDNFVHLLENFANTSPPNYPLNGQLWYDSGERRLKVYDATIKNFVGTSGTYVSASVPSGITKGDLWIDTTNGQLWFNDGIANRLAGPAYSNSQQISGFNVETVLDTNGGLHTVVVLYVAHTILGIFSKDTFIPATPITGFTSTAQFLGYQVGNVLTVTSVANGQLSIGQTVFGSTILINTQITDQLTGNTGSIGTYTVSNSNTVGSVLNPVSLTATNDVINIGFNVSSYPGTVFNVLASQASSLLAADGSLKTAESFLSTQSNSSTTGTIVIQNNTPLVVGANSDISLSVNSATNTFALQSNIVNQNLQLIVKSNGAQKTPFYVNAQNQYVGIFTTTPTATLDVAGDVVVEGNLTVNGFLETIKSTIVTIADKNIVLGQTALPTDTTASNGGITVAGQTQKIISWTSTANTSNSSSNTGYWNFSDFVNVGTSGTGAGYYLNAQPVVTVNTNNTQFSLGSNITSAPGLTSVGSLSTVQAGNLTITSNTISYTSIQTSGNIVLQPKGTGSVDVNSSNIINVASPQNIYDAANKLYVDFTIKGTPLGISLNTTGLNNITIATTLLAKIFPVTEHSPLTICRVQCSDLTLKEYQIVGNAWSYQSDIF
jgi:hypothetical protein